MSQTKYKHDAVFLVSFGGPEAPEDVMPFLENVLRGKNVPEARKLEVAENYHQFGGKSPINPMMRELKMKLEAKLAEHNIDLPVYWGNRNWKPLIADELQLMHQEDIKRPLAFVTSAFSSYSGCRQYREDIAGALESQGLMHHLQVSKIRAFFNHPLFIEAALENIKAVLDESKKSSTYVIFTAHSLPLHMSQSCTYEQELREVVSLISTSLGLTHVALAYQSRSGPPSQPWLEPSVLDVISDARTKGFKSVLVMPIGFVSDHMEVVYDLDFQAKNYAEALGLEFLRAKTVGHNPLYIDMILDLIEERIHEGRTPKVVGQLPAKPNQCSIDCCKMPARP